MTGKGADGFLLKSLGSTESDKPTVQQQPRPLRATCGWEAVMKRGPKAAISPSDAERFFADSLDRTSISSRILALEAGCGFTVQHRPLTRRPWPTQRMAWGGDRLLLAPRIGPDPVSGFFTTGFVGHGHRPVATIGGDGGREHEGQVQEYNPART